MASTRQNGYEPEKAEMVTGGTRNTNYVTRLVMAECSMGTMSNYLNLPEDHGILFKDQDHPIMNANDHEGGEEKNVVHFGRCNSKANPGNQFSLGNAIMGALIPGSTLIKKALGCSGCKCVPMTLQPWIENKKDHMVEGAPCLTDKSTLVCYYGGIISIVPPEEQEEDEQAEAEANHSEYDKQEEE